MPLPPFTLTGDLPAGVHPATLAEVLERFGREPAQRRLVAQRLVRVYRAARSTGQLARFVVFGSFVTGKPAPNDVDVFMLMDDAFDVAQVWGETRLLFEHAAAQAHFGASVFWIRRQAALEGEEAVIALWQVTRKGRRRGIVELLPEAP